MGQTIKCKMYMKIKGNINKFNHMLPEFQEHRIKNKAG